MAFSVSARSPALAEINITPLIDVMLVLLIIFMVSAPLVSTPLSATLPQRADPQPLPAPNLMLSVLADGGYRLDDRALSLAQLQERLAEAANADARASVSVRANADAEYQTMATALAAVSEAGVRHVAVLP